MRDYRFRYMIGKSLAALLILVFTQSCKRSEPKEQFKKSDKGYWFRLISFEYTKKSSGKPAMAWVSAAFKTQDDSLFYDTKNDLRDRFFVHTDTSYAANVFKTAVSYSTEGDSLCILVNTSTFFKEQFRSPVPLFCRGDSVLKIYYKVKKLLTEAEYQKTVNENTSNELQEIESFFGSAEQFERARDPLGFYWVERPSDIPGESVQSGTTLSVSYSGGFLNGRVIDVSPHNFQVVYGTPDQLLKGLNYVIGRLKIGQTTKIILPSQLAFGESGSSNGSVPPFTPMLYKISINN